MPDPTDAYCERCGNRFDFLSDRPGPLSRKRARIVATGLKDFIQTDWRSLDAAMKLAHDDAAHKDFARATEAFQQAFNFCFTCRRSVCRDCWSEDDGACRGCAPVQEPASASAQLTAPVQVLERAQPIVPQPQPDVVQTQTLRPSLVRLIADLGPNGTGSPSPERVLAEAGPDPVPWPRPTPWRERPIGVHGRDAGAKATTVQATRNGTESPPDESAVASSLGRDPVPVMAEPGWTDGVCHNCGLPVPPRGRFCRRCGLLIARWVEGDSVREELAVGQD